MSVWREAAAVAVAVLVIGATVVVVTEGGDDGTTPRAMEVGSSLHRKPGETYRQAYTRRCADWQVCPDVVRYFYPGLPSGEWPSFGDSVEVVSFKVDDMEGFASGANDAVVTEFLSTVPRDGSAHYVTLWHEPEDDVEAGRFTEAEFRAAVQHLQQLVAESTAESQQVRVGVVLMGFTARPAAARSVDDYVVQNLDFLGWDVYTSISDPEDTRTGFQLAADACDAAAVEECFLTETAPRVAPDTSQDEIAEWLTSSLAIAREEGFDAVMYFDSTVGGDFRLRQPVAWQAIGQEISR